MKLIKGGDLTPTQRAEVLRAFVHRNTAEHPYPRSGGIAFGTDEEYLQAHAFYIKVDGHLATVPRFCEPAYMAEWGDR